MTRRKNLSVVFFIFTAFYISGQTYVAINPNIKYQKVEGWGGSLSWWANIAGGYSDAQIDELCTWITSPSGLNMNVFVYNIGGGDNPNCPYGSSHLRTDANIQGYKPTETGGYDWTRDAKQRKILMKLKQKRSDCIFSACSYSPPWWMTYSGCSSGNIGGGNNLKTNYYDSFANYLTDVVKYFHDSLGVTFRTIAPMNEPTNAWTAGGTQEGCSIWESSNQSNLINAVYNKLSAKGMLGYCTIAAIDGSYVNQTVTGVNALINDGRISKISQINTHTYGGNQHALLKTLADQHGKRLWQSESGPVNVNKTGWDNNLTMAKRIIYDMNVLKPVVWLDWQLMDQGDVWGLIQYNSSNNYWKIKNYYARMHFSRFIKPGYNIIDTSNDTLLLAALNPDSTELVVVACNSSSSDIDCNLDLNLFGTNTNSASVYKTTSGLEAVHWLASSYNVSTYQTITGLANGTYTAKAWIISSGGQTNAYFSAKGFGGTEMKIATSYNQPVWKQITIPNIKVINGQCSIGFTSFAGAGKWITFDNVEFYNNEVPTVNLIVNPDFESESASQTIYGWATSGNNPEADYTQAGGITKNENCSRMEDILISNNRLNFTASKRSIYTFVIPVNIQSNPSIENGIYRIRAKHSNKYMSVADSSVSDGAIIEQTSLTDNVNLNFDVQNTASGYKITPTYIAKPINVSGYSMADGAPVITYSDWAGTNQRFSIIDVGSGFFKIVARHSSKCLAVKDSGTNNGDDVLQYKWFDADNFKWSFDRATSLPDHHNQLKFSISPNPASDEITVNYDGDSRLVIKILDINGRKVLERKLISKVQAKINIEYLSAGVYFVQVVGDNNSKTEKLIKE